MFKVQTPANTGKKPNISKEYVQSKPTEHLWGDFMKQVGSYARKNKVIKNQKNRDGAGNCWYNNNSNPGAAV